MKVAIILTGHMRCWKHVWPHFKSQYVDVYNPDVYVSTWSDEGWWRPNSKRGFDDQSPKLDVDAFKELYNPVEMHVEDFTDVEADIEAISKKYPNYIHNPKNVVSMYYKIAKGYELVHNQSKKYDLIIRTRLDLVFNHKLPILDPNYFNTTHHPNYYNQGTGDTFQASSQENIHKFCTIFYHLDEFYSKTNLLCPHVLAKTAADIIGNHREVSHNFKLIHTPYGHYFNTDENYKSIILDVGANDHGISQRFLTKNNLEVHSFEPVNEIFNWVSNNINDPRLIKNKLAVDINDGTAIMNIAAWEKWFCNSLHQFTDDINKKWKGEYHHNKPNFYFTGQQEVQTIRLDTYCKNKNIDHIDYLWISASGNDFNVLKSLGSMVDNVKQGHIVASVDTQLYNSDNHLDNILDWLQENNFEWHIEYDDDKFMNEAEVFFFRQGMI